MKLYRAHYYTYQGGSEGFEFFTNKREALKDIKKWLQDNDEPLTTIEEWSLFTEIDVEPTKQGILSALNGYGCHADNG